MTARAFVVALVGAESTGKTTLAGTIANALALRGETVRTVDEYLRVFCATHARTPHQGEQQAIAAEQTRRIDEAAASGVDVVVADTSALMVAVYSDFVFGDTALYAEALIAHRRCDLTLLTALDLPWRADGMQREGEHVRAPIDALVRAALSSAGVTFETTAGEGSARLDAALRAIVGARACKDQTCADRRPGEGEQRRGPGQGL